MAFSTFNSYTLTFIHKIYDPGQYRPGVEL